VLPRHSPVISPVERARREQFHAWVQRQGKLGADPDASADACKAERG
jgi:hypothetical protein